MLVPIGRPPSLPQGAGGRRDGRDLGVSSGEHWLRPFSWILGKGPMPPLPPFQSGGRRAFKPGSWCSGGL